MGVLSLDWRSAGADLQRRLGGFSGRLRRSWPGALGSLSNLVAPGKSLERFGELYHDYRLFGARSRQLPGAYAPNQRCKEPVIGGYIQLAIAKCRRSLSDRVGFTELFCADGYYAMLARHFGADACVGVDNDRDGHFSRAEAIARELGLSNVRFVKADVQAMHALERTEIVANVGGLYHVENPLEVLVGSYALASRFLIVQTVVSTRHTADDYFESPAPGWHWGSRFSAAWLARRIAERGWQVVDSHYNELEGNARPEDRGSAYYLIRVAG